MNAVASPDGRRLLTIHKCHVGGSTFATEAILWELAATERSWNERLELHPLKAEVEARLTTGR